MRRVGLASGFALVSLFFVLGGAIAAEAPYVFVGKFGSGPGSATGQFVQPNGIAIEASAGNVYVADTSNNRIQEFGPTGVFIRAFGSAGELANPVDVAVDRQSPFDVYVTDTNNHRIRKYNATGQLIATWGTQGTQPGQLILPRGLANDAAGNLYVAQPDRVTVFTSTGTFLRTWGTVGSGDGQFRYLADVAVDPAGNVYTVDRDLNRVQKFSSSGAFVAKWGSQGNGQGQLSGPLGITADETGVYVSDTSNARIEKFSADGQFLTQWGSRGAGDGQFAAPAGIAVSPRSPNDVYVVEFLAQPRVQYFRRPTAGGPLPAPGPGVANATAVSGTVTVRVKGTTAFVTLASQQIPAGSEIDATKGRVRLTSLARGGATQTAEFYEGRFLISQAGTGDRTTVLQLSAPLRCPRRLAATNPPGRHLWGSGKGRFRTKGKYAAATVRGTVWLTRDTCTSTLIRVRSGRVSVFDVVRRRTVTVTAGKSYTARRR
jgi:DNA-binding beta-propeller fold protein YncE